MIPGKIFHGFFRRSVICDVSAFVIHQQHIHVIQRLYVRRVNGQHDDFAAISDIPQMTDNIIGIVS